MAESFCFYCIFYVKNIPIYRQMGIFDKQRNKNIKLALTLQEL